MGRNPTKAAGNRYFESRKRAAEHDERLTSRERAGDLLGVSWSSMADYERGLTRVPVDVVIRMRGLMDLTKRVEDKKMGFRLTYESELKDRTEKETLREWLWREERWQKQRQKTKSATK